jgi:hypothetical protein
MSTPRPILKSAVVVWAVVLGLLFVIAYHAVAVLGTKSTGTFKYVAPATPGTRVPVSGPSANPDTNPSASAR